MRLNLLAFALAGVLLQPSAPTEIRLIVKGDDMGAAHGINVGTIKAFRDGILRTTNVIVAGPWFLEAAKMLRENPDLDVGVHLALTSEWDIRQVAATHLRGVDCRRRRLLFPGGRAAAGYPPKTSLKEAPWKLDEIERELRAQLDAAKKHLPQATYTWYHMGFTSLDPSVRDVAAKLTKEYGLVQATDVGFKSLGRIYEGTDSGAVKADKLAARLETLEPGLWLLIDHGSTHDPEMQAIGHRGYENVAADRSANVEMWTSPKVREVVARRGIKLTNYRELTKKSSCRDMRPPCLSPSSRLPVACCSASRQRSVWSRCRIRSPRRPPLLPREARLRPELSGCHGTKAQGAAKAGVTISIIPEQGGKQPPDLTDSCGIMVRATATSSPSSSGACRRR